MRRQIGSEMSLIIGLKHIQSKLPSSFTYTCFLWISPQKLFQSPPFQLKSMLICGTAQGSLIALTIHEKSLIPVCLMIGHTAKVTDIIMSLQNNTFLSIDNTGTILGWHSYDCSCRFRSKHLLPPADYHFSLHPLNPIYIWTWSTSSIYLIDLSINVIVTQILYPGLISFSILTPNLCHLVDLPIIVCIGIDKITSFLFLNDNQIIQRFDEKIDKNSHYFASLYGILQYSGSSWAILRPRPLQIFFSAESQNSNFSDGFIDASWTSENTICLATISSNFYFVTLSPQKDNLINMKNDINNNNLKNNNTLKNNNHLTIIIIISKIIII